MRIFAQWLWINWRAFPWTFKKLDTWCCSCFWILMVGDAFKANRRKIVCVLIPVVMVRRSSGFGVAWVFSRGRAINILCRRIRVARSVIWRWITWLVHFKPYGLSIGLKTQIGTRRWRIARHLVCCLFTFGHRKYSEMFVFQSEICRNGGITSEMTVHKNIQRRFSRQTEMYFSVRTR